MKTKLILPKSAFSFRVSPSGGPGRADAELPTASRAPWSVAKLAFLCLLAACCLAIPAHAGVVTSLADDGSAGTLRAVIEAASPGDTISFDVAGTITLTNGEFPVLFIDKDLTIAGPGAAHLAVNGNAASPVFGIWASTVTIAGLTITNGFFPFNNVGGGINSQNATLTVSNCTLSGNSARGFGGGIYNSQNATVEIGSTILAGARGGNFSGAFTSDGYNLSSDGGGGYLNQPTDLTNTNAMLGPLQFNGGPTPTPALLCGSPAIDHGTNFLALATDQRGEDFPRTFGAATDIGAFEVRTPVVAITGPASGSVFAVGTPVLFTGAFASPHGPHTAQWTIDGNVVPGIVNESAQTVTATVTFAGAGVYQVQLSVTNACGNSGTADTVDGLQAMVVIYDPSAGFVTGGGWINSPAGAAAWDATLTGKANFGFVSRYKKGQSVPTGETEFQFKAGNLKFNSTSYDWLVVSGARAQYKGAGTINGVAGYSFMLTAIDCQLNGGGSLDRFRVKIWETATSAVVYDNQMGADDGAPPSTGIGGGSIVIQK